MRLRSMPFLLPTPTNITAALIAINLIAFAAFGLDKSKATRGQYRIAESTLLLFAFLGGTLGAPSTGSGLGAGHSGTRPASSRSARTCSRSRCCRCSRWAG